MEQQIAINIGGMKYQIVSNSCNAERVKSAVDHLLEEQKKRLKDNGQDTLRATIMIAISSIYEQGLLSERLEDNENELKELQTIREDLQIKIDEIKKLKHKNEKLNKAEKRLKELQPEHEKLIEKQKKMEALSLSYNKLVKKEKELELLTGKYEDLLKQHSEIEEVMNFAIEETERLTHKIALHIA